MKYSELFEPEPENWGLRGDPFLWRELKEHFGDKEIPDDEGTLYLSIFRYCCDRCKVGLNMAETAFVEDYAKGGMSSGEVSCKWWRATGIPLLLKRAAYEKPNIAYDYYYVFYKTTTIPGWEIAFVTVGPNNSIENIIKHKRKWIETKSFCGTKTDKYYSPIFPIILAPGTMHQNSLWIYNLELKKYFLPDEIIPIPTSKAKQDFFNYEIMLKDDLDDGLDDLNLDLDEEYDWDVSKGKKTCFSFRPILKINDSVKIYLRFCDCFYELISNLYYELKTNKYSFIKINERYFKFLFWDCGDNIRFKIQDYNMHTQVEEPVDIEMSKSEFFEKFNAMFEELQNNLDNFKLKFNRCTETIGSISYKKLNYNSCTYSKKNNKYIDHASLFENDEHKSIELSLLMDPNYKSIEQQIEEVENWTEKERETYRTRYYVDDSDFVWAVNQGKVFSYNYVEDRFIPSNKGIDLMKWHEFPECELPDMIKLKQNLFSQDISD